MLGDIGIAEVSVFLILAYFCGRFDCNGRPLQIALQKAFVIASYSGLISLVLVVCGVLLDSGYVWAH